MIFYLLFSFLPFIISDTQCYEKSSILINDRRLNLSTFRLVQYNVEWLFVDQYKDCPGSGCTWESQKEALIHLDYISSIINELKPDLINFCEIEGCDELNLLINKTTNDYQPYLIKGKDTATGQNVGFLSKIDPLVNIARTDDRYDYPLINNTCNYNGDNGTYSVSKNYYSTFSINNMDIVIIGAHLLSRPTDSTRCVSREAQAQVLQNLIYNFTLKYYEIILIGDLNDYDNEFLDINDNLPTSRVLDILKGNVGDYRNMFKLKSVLEFIDKKNRYTEWYDANKNCKVETKEYSLIDHILVSPKLFDLISNTYIYHGYNESCNTYYSDHYPVIIDFLF